MKFLKIENIVFNGGNNIIEIDVNYNILSTITNGRVGPTFHQMSYVDATNNYSFNLLRGVSQYNFTTISNINGIWNEINIIIYYTK